MTVMTKRCWTLVVLFLIQVFEIWKASAFAPIAPAVRRNGASKLYATQSDLSLDILVSKGDEKSISEAAVFMVDAFWLGSGRLLVPVQDDNDISVPEATRRHLLEEQESDLTAKYGERMGKRLLESSLLAAFDKETGDILGVVGLETSLLDNGKGDILGPELAESTLKNAVASLGPKQRRQFKDSSVVEITKALLPPDLQLVACLSNLAVSTNARRRGIAAKLCAEAERIVSSEWNFDSLFLKVESENSAARRLYEEKLAYKQEYTLESAPAVRIDVDAGCLIEAEASTLILSKTITL